MKLHEILDQYGPDAVDEGSLPDPLEDTNRYVLVEESIFGDNGYWITTHATIKDAEDYKRTDESQQDYRILFLHDTETGQNYDGEWEVTFTPRVDEGAA